MVKIAPSDNWNLHIKSEEYCELFWRAENLTFFIYYQTDSLEHVPFRTGSFWAPSGKKKVHVKFIFPLIIIFAHVLFWQTWPNVIFIFLIFENKL